MGPRSTTAEKPFDLLATSSPRRSAKSTRAPSVHRLTLELFTSGLLVSSHSALHLQLEASLQVKQLACISVARDPRALISLNCILDDTLPTYLPLAPYLRRLRFLELHPTALTCLPMFYKPKLKREKKHIPRYRENVWYFLLPPLLAFAQRRAFLSTVSKSQLDV